MKAAVTAPQARPANYLVENPLYESSPPAGGRLDYQGVPVEVGCPVGSHRWMCRESISLCGDIVSSLS